MTCADDGKERSGFEVWALTQEFFTPDFVREQDTDEYQSVYMRALFRGWLAARSQPSEWVATSERQPKDHELVLAYHPKWGIDITMTSDGYPLQTGLTDAQATHWMPLPKPPALLPPDTEAK